MFINLKEKVMNYTKNLNLDLLSNRTNFTQGETNIKSVDGVLISGFCKSQQVLSPELPDSTMVVDLLSKVEQSLTMISKDSCSSYLIKAFNDLKQLASWLNIDEKHISSNQELVKRYQEVHLDVLKVNFPKITTPDVGFTQMYPRSGELLNFSVDSNTWQTLLSNKNVNVMVLVVLMYVSLARSQEDKVRLEADTLNRYTQLSQLLNKSQRSFAMLRDLMTNLGLSKDDLSKILGKDGELKDLDMLKLFKYAFESNSSSGSKDPDLMARLKEQLLQIKDLSDESGVKIGDKTLSQRLIDGDFSGVSDKDFSDAMNGIISYVNKQMAGGGASVGQLELFHVDEKTGMIYFNPDEVKRIDRNFDSARLGNTSLNDMSTQQKVFLDKATTSFQSYTSGASSMVRDMKELLMAIFR
jgi:hypothetical protein